MFNGQIILFLQMKKTLEVNASKIKINRAATHECSYNVINLGREAHCILDNILASHPATLGSILGIGVSKKLILLNLFSKCHHEITRQCTACTVDISSSLVDNWTHPVPASGKLLLRYSY